MGTSVVTLLFTDLVGSTDLYQRLGDEGAEDVRRRHFRLLRDAVASRGGHEVKSLGDGLMVVFDSAVEAVACAITMQQAVHRANLRDPESVIGVRVGLHTGEPIRDEDDYFGTPVAVAKRLCDSASGGQIFASALVEGLAGSRSFTFNDLGRLELKGLANPMQAYEVAWEPATTSRIPLPAQFEAHDRLALVGREAEAEMMRVAFKHALTGRPQLILLAGEPGIGKTRLATEFGRWAYDEGATVLLGRCDEEPLAAYQPIVEALTRYVKSASTEELRANAGRHAPTLTNLIPDVRDRLPGIPGSMSGDPETERVRLFDAVTGLVRAAAHDAPVVLVIDDVHWAQQPALLLMRHLVREAEDAKLVVVATYRETELGRTHPLAELLAELRRDDTGVTRIMLRGLDEDGVVSFLERASGEHLPAEGLELARSLHEITEGNPFFLREVLRHLLETGAILQREGHWAGARPVSELGLPEGVKEVIGRRLSTLSDETNRVLRVASVIGREFDLALLREATGLDEEVVLSSVEEAVAARTVGEVPSALDHYTFTHALIRETLLGELTTSRRVRLHRAVGEAIERLHADVLDEYLTQLSYHFGEAAAAGEALKAIGYARRSAERAMRLLAYEEAIDQYTKAIEWLESVATTDERLLCELLVELGVAQQAAIGSEVGRETVRRALPLARELGDDELVAAAVLAFCGRYGRPGVLEEEVVTLLEGALRSDAIADTARAALLSRLANEYIAVDEERCKALADEALALARAVGDPLTVGRALWVKQWVDVIDVPLVDELIAIADEIRTSARAANDGYLEWVSSWVRLRAALIANDATMAQIANASMSAGLDEFRLIQGPYFERLRDSMYALFEGRLEDAELLVHEALAEGQRIGEPIVMNQYSAQLLSLRWTQGRLAELEPVMRMMIESDPEIPWYAAHALVLSYIGRTEDAREVFERFAVHDFANVKRDANWLAATGALAITCWLIGDAERASVLRRILEPWAGCNIVVGAPCFLSMNGSHHLAMLSVAMGDWDAAERYFDAALADYEPLGIKTWPIALRREYAAALARRTEGTDIMRAKQLAERALADAEALGMRGEVAEARKILDELIGVGPL